MTRTRILALVLCACIESASAQPQTVAQRSIARHFGPKPAWGRLLPRSRPVFTKLSSECHLMKTGRCLK
jgi:hypothetical protein